MYRRSSTTWSSITSPKPSIIADDELLSIADELGTIFSCIKCQSGSSLFQIQCGHSLCDDCLKDDECPVCEIDIDLKEEDVFGEALYIEIASLKETLKGKKSVEKMSHTVDVPVVVETSKKREAPKVVKEAKAKGRDAITQTINDKRSISIQCDTPVAIGTVDVEVQCDLLFSPEKKFKKRRVLPKSEVEVKRDAKAEITIAQNSIPEAKFETSPTLFKDFLGTSSRRIRNRTVLLNEKKDVVVLGSGLETVQKRKLENAAATLNFKLASEWSPSVTHLVVSLASNVDKKEKLTIRSLKYLMALMSNKWIVSFDWILVSEKYNRLVFEEEYEVRGYRGGPTINCPKNSRLENIRLLSNYVFYFNGPFKKFQSYDEMKTAVSLADAKVAHTLKDFSSLMNDQTNEAKKFLIINDKDDTRTVLPDFTSVVHMTVSELVDKMANLEKP